MACIVTLFFLFGGINFVQAKDVTEGNPVAQLHNDTKQIKLDSYIDVLVDKEQTYTIEEISSGKLDEAFSPYTRKGRPNYGYTDSAYWIRFQIANDTSVEDWLLEIDTPKMNHMTLYQPTETGGFKETTLGNAYTFQERNVQHRNFIFNLSAQTDDVETYYIRFETGGAMQFPLTIWQHTAFDQKSQVEYMLFGILIGISIIMALYNLFLYFSIGDRSYLYYVLFVVFNALLYISDSGLGFQFLWSDYVSWNLSAVVTFICLDNIGALLFTRRFLQTDRFFRKLDKVFQGLIVLNAISAIWSLFSLTLAMYVAIICIILTIIIVLTTVMISLKNGYRPARFFAVGWTIFLFGVFVSVLVDAGVIPYVPFTKYAWQVTTAIEVILLSLALGDRYKTIRREKEKAEKEAAESQRTAIKNLRKADKLKDEFLTVTSHELRTPLNGIIGIAETLRAGAAGPLSDDLDRHLWMIAISGRRLANLVNDIIDFSKLKNDDLDIQPEPIQLSSLTDVVLTVCRPLAKDKPITIRNHVKDTLPLVLADKDRLQQILYNLIGNAIKYTEKGEVTVSAHQLDHQLNITVSDTGKGIDANQIPDIFEPFYQGDIELSREDGGSGIGLSITKRLVELHGGEIHVHSRVGFGSMFSFSLPISQEQRLSSDEKILSKASSLRVDEGDYEIVSAAPGHPGQKDLNILIADDEFVNLQVLKNQLTLEGYRVTAVSNGEAVLKEVKAQHIQIVILDIMMPKMSGYDVCRRLREHYSLLELPILMLTAKDQMQDKVAAFEAGANDYLSKPCDKQELLSRVKTLIQLSWLNEELINMNRLLEQKVEARTEALQHANQDLAKANDELVHMAKSRRELLANIVHELGTPVTLIQGYVEAVKEGLIPLDHSRYIQMVFHKVKILERLINDLSDLSKLEAGQINLNRKDVYLNEWLEQIYTKLELDLQHENRTWSFESEPNTAALSHFVCYVDTDRMDQVFFNLIWNAIKHTSIDGKITLESIVGEAADEVTIRIRDNGEGIREEVLLYIFERFYKGGKSIDNDNTAGMGLGLAIVKEIIQAHDGIIWAESEEGVGTVFTIVLPIYARSKRGRRE
ncbi:ATP-binding protein [Lentibacillus saliphilus]|uniref:ATP-binding protein n=1 Tax=Lentibacillus saliphilus TaxID=2737028 RepID=UPI001C2F7F29|nr:ATP-binding protein [Lentibacillus saliphilus]